MSQIKRSIATEMVRHNPTTKNKVAKHVAGTKETIGEFYDKAAEEKLKKQSNKK